MNLDTKILLWINQAGTPNLDPWVRQFSLERNWIILGLVLGGYFLVRRTYRRLTIGILLAVGFADTISYRVLKPFFERFRPCFADIPGLRIVDGCGGFYGFPSNHAANAFALLTLILLYYRNPWTYAMIPLAISVGLSRIYLGVHYPGDVIFGFCVGILCAVLSYWLTRPRSSASASASTSP